MVASITGIPPEQFLEIAKIVGETGRPDKVMTVVYAVGLTHHTTGGQLIRTAAILQLLLGNMGRPGGGMNAERGHANIQGNTDNAISWEILPGYLRIPAPGQKNLDDYVDAERAQEVRRELLELLRHELPEVHGQPAQDLVRGRGDEARTSSRSTSCPSRPPTRRGSRSSTRRSRGKMEGVILSGMTATSIGPDANQVHDRRSATSSGWR